MRYLVIIEKGDSSWGAHVPDLPGCVAVAKTREEVIELVKKRSNFTLTDFGSTVIRFQRPHLKVSSLTRTPPSGITHRALRIGI